MPVELSDMVRAYSDRENRKEKENWRRIRWLGTQIINISGKEVKHPIRPEQLIQFKDEIIILSPEERERRSIEILKHFKSKFWTLLKLDENGNVKIFGEEEYQILKEKRLKTNG